MKAHLFANRARHSRQLRSITTDTPTTVLPQQVRRVVNAAELRCYNP